MKYIFTILMLFVVSVAVAQSRVTLTGQVTDPLRQPMVGVQIIVEGTTTGTTTGLDGVWVLKNIPAEATLLFSLLGYETQMIKPEGRSVINIQMAESSVSVGEVVVLGYGTSVAKRDLTGAISSLSERDIEIKSPINIFDAIQGMSAGVQITSTSGEPGAGSDIRIRGTSTFGSGTLPLFVVDGMPMEGIDMINPSDIASIEIMKDAASAAIYGSRSANGVVLVTTKRGTSGKPRLDVSYMRSYSSLAHIIPMTSPEYARLYMSERYRLTGGVNGFVTDDSLKGFYNWDGRLQDYLFRMSAKDQANVSISGATDRMNYYLTGGYLGEDGIVVNSGYSRLNLRANTQYKATSRLTVGSKISMSVAKKNGAPESNMVVSMYNWVPYWNIFDADGNIMHNLGGKTSAYAVAMLETNKQDNYRASALVYGEYAIDKYLKFTSNLSGDFLLGRTFYYRPTPLLSSTGRTTGRDWTDLRYNYLWENYFNYNRTFGNHAVTAMVGASMQSWHDEIVRIQGLDYTTDLVYTLSAASEIDTKNTTSRIEEHAMASYFARATYSYKSRYLLSANLRYDGSSRFGRSNRWGAFPSASVAWRFSDLVQWKPLSDAKLRISYGLTGNEAIGNYDAWLTYSAGNFYGGSSGIAPITLAYDQLGWEQTAQTNIGTDLSFFNGRLRMSFDWYDKYTTNLLYNVDVPKETGYTTIRKNVGAMRNSGVELTAEATIINTKRWRWDVSANISTNNGIIEQLSDGIPFYTGTDNAIYVQQGHRIGEFYGFRHDGVFAYNESNAFTDNWEQLTPVFAGGVFTGYTINGQTYTGNVNQKLKKDGTAYVAGDVNWLDNPNSPNIGIIDENDKVYLGCAQPDFFGGINSTLSYRGFSLFVSLYYSIGGELYNRIRYNRNNFANDYIAPEPYVLDNMWRYEGDEAIYPVPTPTNSDNRLAAADYWIEDASYVKLRSLKLSYDLPKQWCKAMGIGSVQAYIYGNNLLTFTRYEGFDPEFGSSSPLAFGIDTGRYPRKIEFGGGLNIRF